MREKGASSPDTRLVSRSAGPDRPILILITVERPVEDAVFAPGLSGEAEAGERRACGARSER